MTTATHDNALSMVLYLDGQVKKGPVKSPDAPVIISVRFHKPALFYAIFSLRSKPPRSTGRPSSLCDRR
jgi:hypothetical protein